MKKLFNENKDVLFSIIFYLFLIIGVVMLCFGLDFTVKSHNLAVGVPMIVIGSLLFLSSVFIMFIGKFVP